MKTERTTVVGEDGTIASPYFTSPKVTYVSSNPSVVSVGTKGKVTAHKEGKVTITVKSATTKYYNARSRKVTVSVTK